MRNVAKDTSNQQSPRVEVVGYEGVISLSLVFESVRIRMLAPSTSYYGELLVPTHRYVLAFNRSQGTGRCASIILFAYDRPNGPISLRNRGIETQFWEDLQNFTLYGRGWIAWTAER
jgi:hypothetical protein